MNNNEQIGNTQEIISVRIANDIHYIEAALSCVSFAAKRFGISQKEIKKLEIATEEAVANVIQYAYEADEYAYIDISVLVEGFSFIISIKDKGKPFDFFSLSAEDEHVSGLGVKMMQNLTDKLEFRNLGSKGREQRLIKHLVSLPEYTKKVWEEEGSLPENITFDIHELREEEAIEVAQCVYNEFGYTYVAELIYYPQQFYEASKKGDIYSLVATAPNGEVAGHLALLKLKDFPGVYEMAIGVVKRKFRKYSIMKKLTEIIIDRAENHLKINALFTQPVAYHTITQKMSNSMSLHASGFMFQYTSDEFSTTFDKGQERCSVACAIRPFKRDTFAELYLPHELKEMVCDICNRMGIERTFLPGQTFDLEDKTEATISINQRTRLGKFYIEKSGKDIEEEIKHAMFTFRKEKCAVVELYLNVLDPVAPFAYEELKKYQFFCTGFLPMSDKGEYLIMEYLISEVVNYDNVTTIEPFTTLLNQIKSLDPNKN